MLDGRSPLGEASWQDYRILLNTATTEERGRSRMPGWRPKQTATPSNEDLHDQLLAARPGRTLKAEAAIPAYGGTVDLVFHQHDFEVGDVLISDLFPALEVTAVEDATTLTVSNETADSVGGPLPAGSLLWLGSTGVKEPVRLIYEAVDLAGQRHFTVATQTRLYTSTGKGRNYRLLADGLGGGTAAVVRTQAAQLGNYVLFSNGIDPVLAWDVGAGPLAQHPQGWSVFQPYDLEGLGFQSAGVVAAFGGFAFLGDVTIESNRQASRVYWSDYNRPLEWLPGVESSAGYVDLGKGETVLAIEPLGENGRCYTNKAIYAIEFVAGDAVFRFREIYRGDDAPSFKHGILNLGSAHLWLTQDSIASLGQYDSLPQRVEWLHKAAGFIFKGINSALLRQVPVPLAAFGPIDQSRCNEIAVGFDSRRGDVWISWPTATVPWTLVLNLHYSKATLVDKGFTAFGSASSDQWESVRDFMLAYRICEDADLRLLKEANPLNNDPPLVSEAPVCIWNSHEVNGEVVPLEDPSLPKTEDSLCHLIEQVGAHTDLGLICESCFGDSRFYLADADTYAILEFSPDTYTRDTLDAVSEATFPEVGEASYLQLGYPTMIQVEGSSLNSPIEKLAYGLNVEFDADGTGKLYAQAGVSNSPSCMDWFGAAPVDLNCRRGVAGGILRPHRPASYQFYRAGTYFGWRLYVGDGSTLSPAGCSVSLNRVTAALKPKNETWTNQ